MSKLSPYTKNTNPYSTKNNKVNTARGSNNMRPCKYIQNLSNNKTQRNEQYTPPKNTDKKRSDSIDMVSLIDNNRALAAENQQLYLMLEERGRITSTLQRKLQDQIMRQSSTLDSIQYEKNKFIAESHQKFKDYQSKIQQLVQEIYILRDKKIQGLRSEQLDITKFTSKKKGQHSPVANTLAGRQQFELEILRLSKELDIRTNELQLLQFEFRSSRDNLNNEIINLNNQIVHINQVNRIKLSDQKLQYEQTIDALKNQFQKERQVMVLQHDSQVNKMQQIIRNNSMETNRIGEHNKMAEIQQNIRENQLIEQKFSLENQIRQLEDFHDRKKAADDQKLKELSQNQIEALSLGNRTVVSNLKTQNIRLTHIINSKSQQVKALYDQIEQQRAQYDLQVQRLEALIDELKKTVEISSKDQIEEEERLKVKWAQLRDADIKSLSSFYQNQIDVLKQKLLVKSQQSDSNRQKLHDELHEKNEMRKLFDIQLLRLSTRIAELELKSNELSVNKREEVYDVNAQKSLTSLMLFRETKQRQKLNQLAEEEKRKLQQLIMAKDKQIEELNGRIGLLKENSLKEMTQKNYEIDLIRKAKENLEVELQKETLFFEKELQRKEIVIRQNRQNYEQHLGRIKLTSRQQYDSAIGQISAQKAALEVELNRAKVLEKNLRNELATLQKHKEEELIYKQEEIVQEKQKLTANKNQAEDNLKRYYTNQISKLEQQIGELKIQLQYKEEDLRKQAHKYSQLQRKLEEVFSSQQKLKNLESMIVEMGQDNNLVKNIAEIVKPRP